MAIVFSRTLSKNLIGYLTSTFSYLQKGGHFVRCSYLFHAPKSINKMSQRKRKETDLLLSLSLHYLANKRSTIGMVFGYSAILPRKHKDVSYNKMSNCNFDYVENVNVSCETIRYDINQFHYLRVKLF